MQEAQIQSPGPEDPLEKGHGPKPYCLTGGRGRAVSGNPVGEGTTRRGAATPVLRPQSGARGGFLPRHDEDLREPLVRRQGSQVSMRVARATTLEWLQPYASIVQ